MKKGIDKLRLAMSAKQQGRLDGFFKAAPKSDSSDAINPARKKRKVTLSLTLSQGFKLKGITGRG